MNLSMLDLSLPRYGSRYTPLSAVDHAIARADLVRAVHERRATLTSTRRRHDEELNDALMRAGMAEAALEDFDREAGRAP